MLQAILFDLDGTLTDPGEGITRSVAIALERQGIIVEDRRTLYPFIGPPLGDSFRKYYGMTEEQSERAIRDYRSYYGVTGLFECGVYAGVPEMLKELKRRGYRLLLATSKPEAYAVRILERMELLPFFEDTAGATMDGSVQKKADVIRLALRRAGISDPADAVMVGDREQDVFGAHTAGLKCVGALWGYGSREEFSNAGADVIAEQPADVADAVDRLRTAGEKQPE